ncbi:MAG: hypothetical protein ACJ71W_07700 [Terriglobales bacterium]
MGILQKLLRTSAADWTYESIDSKHVADGLDHVLIKPRTSYISIFLHSMRIVDVRKGWNKFYPAVHSYISIPHQGGEAAEFQVVTSPSKMLELDAAHVDRVIAVNHRLLGPAPYRGGDLKIEIGLFSVKSSDLAKPFLSVLETMATTAGVSFVTVAKPFVDPIKMGLELLTGSHDLTLEIGLATTLNKPETGYFFVMRAARGTLDVSDLRVAKDGRLVDRSNQPVSNYPYLVFRVEASDARDDWFLIPDIAAIHSELQKSVRAGKGTATEQLLAEFKRVVLTSPDLLPNDAQRLANEITAEVEKAIPTQLTKTASAKLRSLKSINLFPKRSNKTVQKIESPQKHRLRSRL